MGYSMKTDFILIGGSVSHNLQLHTSDIDVLCLTDDERFKNNNNSITSSSMVDGKLNILRTTKDAFLQNFDGRFMYSHCWQWLYPSEFKSNNQFVQWIIENRDLIVSSCKSILYDAYFDRINRFHNNLPGRYQVASKSICYAIMYMNILIEYEGGREFKECIYQTGSVRDHLLDIRCRRLPVEDVLQEYESKMRQVEKLYDFYHQTTEKSIIDELSRLVNSLVFIDYDDFIKEHGSL